MQNKALLKTLIIAGIMVTAIFPTRLYANSTDARCGISPTGTDPCFEGRFPVLCPLN